MKRILSHLFVVVMLMLSATSWAQFSNGKVYRIVCSGTTSVSLGATALTDVAAVSTNETDKSQQWYVTSDGSNYTFRNLANGRYLQGNNNTSSAWGLTEESNDFTVTEISDNYCIRGVLHSNGYGYMHKDAGNNIVSWETNNANSQWTPIMVEYDADELAAIWEHVETLVVPSATVSGYQAALDAIFADQACTQLNPAFAAKDVNEIKSDANYQALPATLQAMVLKVKGGDWSEANAIAGKEGWSCDYAKRFRVQMYEPYSIEGEVTSYLHINAHCNMDNPTGIYANSGEAVYIMVDGNIADGAELWVAHQAGLGATGYYNGIAYAQLHEGLNIVPYFNDASTLWINYLVHTYNKDGATIAEKFPENRKLSNYEPLKIHIEGGYINGYYNAIGDYRASAIDGSDNLWGEVDNDEDWNYYKKRAPLNGTDAPNRDFPLLGHRQTLLYPLGDQVNGDGNMDKGLLFHLDNITVPTTPNCNSGDGNTFGIFTGSYPHMNLDASNGKINIMIEAWDRIMYSELATMGLVSTATMDKMNTLYPRWTSEGSPAEIYDYKRKSTLDGKTYLDFCQGVDYSEYFNHHGAAVGAPSGYMSGGWRVCNYHYNTMGSIIGKIAAEAGPTWGPAHEIGHQHQGVFNLNGQTEVTNNFFSNVAVWYMGMGTSRINGNEGSLESVLGAFNTDGNDLYTNNIWAITHLYYRLWLYYHLAGNNTQFWPRLFELCRQVPLVNGGQISGETSLLRFYKHACHAAGEDLTEFFRAHGFFEVMNNRHVGDYSNATYNVTQSQIDAAIAEVKAKNYPVNYAVLFINDATDETTLKHDGATRRSLWDSKATAEFGSVNDFIDGDVETITNYTATISADGAITMSGGKGAAGFIVLNEKGELVSFSNKATFKLGDEAAYLIATGKATIQTVDVESKTAECKVDFSAIQREMLKALIDKVEGMPIDDGSYRYAGFYTKASATELLAAVETAKIVLASDNGHAAAYELLYTEKEKFVNSSNLSFVPFDPSLTYIVTSYAYKGNTMYLNSGVHSNAGIDQSLNTSRWKFETTGTDDVYNILNASGGYLAAASKSALVSTVPDKASAAAYSLMPDSPVGTWSISVSPAAEYSTLHDNSHGNVVGWEAGASASKWYLMAVECSDNTLATPDVDELQTLIAKSEYLVKTIGYANEVELQTSDAKAPFYLWCNANVTYGSDASMPEKGYNILDGNDRTFLHTVFDGNSQDGLHHYLRLDMGEGNSLSNVQFSYKTRHNGDSKSHPRVIKVEGSNDLSSFEEIVTISEGLPNEYSAVYTSPELSNGKSYRYFRFMVTDTYGTPTDDNGHKYFYIAEFGIPSLFVRIGDDYQPYIEYADMVAIHNALENAKAALESGSDLSEVKNSLSAAYESLKGKCEKNSDEKKDELRKLIDKTNALIAKVSTRTETEIPEKTISLSNSNVYCNATIAEGELDNLFKDDNTFIHTQWTGHSADGDYHYLRVDVGEEEPIDEFYFTYTTASRVNKDMPGTIVVEGANEIDGDNSTKDVFTEIVTLTAADGLPQETNTFSDYKSNVLGDASKCYRYLRFKVMSTQRNTFDGNGKPYFTMAKFGLVRAAYTKVDVEIKESYRGTGVTEELLSAINRAVVNAGLLLDNTSSLELLDAQIIALQAACDTLEGAIAQTPVVTVNNIGTAPFQLSDEDAAKIFGLDNLTIVLDVTTAASLSGRGAFFCVADPAQPVPSSFSGTNTSYMACGHSDASIAYIAAANGGQHFSTGTIPANSIIRIAYVFDKTNNKFKSYIGDTNTGWTHDRNFGNYEIATPKMVKEDFENAKIYIGGGMANNETHETGDAIIHSVRVFDGVLDVNAIKALDKIVINSAEDFKNGKIYTFVTNRGWMGAKDDNNNVISTAKASHNLTGSKDDANFQWTVYKSENGNYYLYNIGKGMFMGVQASNNASVPFVASPTGKNLTFKVSSSLEYPIMFSTNNSAVVNHSTDRGDGCISWTGGWNKLDDEGSNHKVEVVGTVSEEVLAKIEKLVAVREIGYFRLKGYSGNYIDASSIYNSATAKVGQMSMKSDDDCNLAGTIFYFDDASRFLNYATGTYTRDTREIGAINDNTKSTWTVGISTRDSEKFVLTDITTTGSKNLHDNDGNRADKCSSVCGERHDFSIEKVDSLPVTISAAKYATFYAPVAVEVPEGVTAHTVTINGEWATLSEALEVIPANTGVVLYAENAGTYAFAITDDVEAIEGNALRGSAAATYYTAAGTYYALGLVGGEVGFYKDEFKNDRFQNNSHKAYLYVPAANGAASFSFRFGEGTTGIDEVKGEIGEVKAIYDLTGRRVEAITAPGIYIVNGKKVLVK